MYIRQFISWSCVFHLVIPSLGKESWQNFVNGNEQNDNYTVQHEPRANDIRNQNDETIQYEFFTWCNQENNNSVQYKLNSHSIKNYQKDNILMEPDNICIQFCCRLTQDNCIFGKNNFSFQNVNEFKSLNKVLQQIINDSCKESEFFSFDNYTNQNTMLSDDGYQSRQDKFIFLMSKCLDVACQDNKTIGNIKMVLTKLPYKIFIRVSLIMSWLCLLITFIVYSICPELRNMHGYALRSYVGSLFLAYTSIYFFPSFHPMMNEAEHFACVTLNCKKIGKTSRISIIIISFVSSIMRVKATSLTVAAFTYNVFMIATFLWQNVICFDILWTFRKFHSIQGNVKRRKMKMLMICSIYAWGSTGIYAIILISINFASNMPENLIQPKICVKQQGIADEAKLAYFYIPVGIIIICNICFFIFTALKIIYTKRDTDRYLKGLESKCHDNNKQRFITYLKLFILMDTTTSIKWTMETVARNYVDQLPFFIWFLVVMTCALQGFIIFVVFVCRKRIKQLLLKQFGCENSSLCCRNSKSNSDSTSLRILPLLPR